MLLTAGQKEEPHRLCHPVGLFLCYSSRESQTGRPGFAAACAGRDGRGRGPAQGGRPTLPGPGCCAACSSCGPRCRRPRPEARPGHGQQGGRVAGRSAEGRSRQLPATARSSLSLDAVTLKGLLHITLVIRPWNPPHLTRRITQRYVPRRHCRAHPAMRRGAQ